MQTMAMIRNMGGVWAGGIALMLGWGGAGGVGAEPPAAAVAEPPKAVDAAPKKKAVATIAHVRIAGSLPDGVGQGGLLADVAPHLHRLIERLDKAAADSRVKGVVIVVESPDLGRGRAEEIRAAIGRIRKAGKPVAACLVSGAPVHYAVAAACDTITMPPAATLELTGVRTEMMFFKSMLDRLGVAAEILQVGEFKGAGEPLTRDSMSPALRAQYESFVGDLYEQLVERVAADRGLSEERVRNLIDVGVFTPEAARNEKLIDAVGYEDEVVAAVADRIGEESPKLARDYAERKFDQELSGVGGLVTLMELFSGRKQAAPLGKNRRIAVVHVTGEIQGGRRSVDGGRGRLRDRHEGDSRRRQRRPGGGDRAADRLPRRVGAGQRSDLAGGRAGEEAGGGEPLRHRGEWRLLHRRRGRPDRGGTGHAHRLDRGGRRQGGRRRGAGEGRGAHRRRQQGQERRLAVDAGTVHRG
jgi:ClpP class serine protease